MCLCICTGVYCNYYSFLRERKTILTILPEAGHGGGELIQVPPPETVSGSPKRQCCIGPGHNHSSLQRLHVRTCMCAPFIIYYEPTYYISIYFASHIIILIKVLYIVCASFFLR